MLSFLLAAAVATASPPANALSEARHAINAGRLEQARKMIANAVAGGATGIPVERLLADLAFKSGNDAEALARYQALLGKFPTDPLLAERAGIAALKTGNPATAAVLLDRATRSPAASWRGWNARGVAADLQHEWEVADLAYSRALALEPNRAELVNNFGWSLLLRGRWGEAVEQLERAAALDPKRTKIADNLELAKTAMTAELPRRRRNESDVEWAARLNDAGVIAGIRGERKRAVAAFSQAIEARSQWFERAANNLAIAQAKE